MDRRVFLEFCGDYLADFCLCGQPKARRQLFFYFCLQILIKSRVGLTVLIFQVDFILGSHYLNSIITLDVEIFSISSGQVETFNMILLEERRRILSICNKIHNRLISFVNRGSIIETFPYSFCSDRLKFLNRQSPFFDHSHMFTLFLSQLFLSHHDVEVILDSFHLRLQLLLYEGIYYRVFGICVDALDWLYGFQFLDAHRGQLLFLLL